MKPSTSIVKFLERDLRKRILVPRRDIWSTGLGYRLGYGAIHTDLHRRTQRDEGIEYVHNVRLKVLNTYDLTCPRFQDREGYTKIGQPGTLWRACCNSRNL